MKGRILFLVEGSAEKGHSPAARFRVVQFLPRYREDGWSCDALWSFPMKYFAAAPFFRKIRTRPFLFYPLAVAAVLCMASHRLLQIVTRAPLADIVVVQRNLLPVRGFPLLEWLAARLVLRAVEFFVVIWVILTWLVCFTSRSSFRWKHRKIFDTMVVINNVRNRGGDPADPEAVPEAASSVEDRRRRLFSVAAAPCDFHDPHVPLTDLLWFLTFG